MRLTYKEWRRPIAKEAMAVMKEDSLAALKVTRDALTERD